MAILSAAESPQDKAGRKHLVSCVTAPDGVCIHHSIEGAAIPLVLQHSLVSTGTCRCTGYLTKQELTTSPNPKPRSGSICLKTNPLTVWAPDAQSVELVTQNIQSFNPQVMLARTTVTYDGHVAIPGYWQTPAGANALQDGDGYWFKIVIDNGATKYSMDPYARALNNDVSWSINKDPARFQWTDQNHRPPQSGQMVIYQLFQGAYEGRGDGNWLDPAGINCNFTWGPEWEKGEFCPAAQET